MNSTCPFSLFIIVIIIRFYLPIWNRIFCTKKSFEKDPNFGMGSFIEAPSRCTLNVVRNMGQSSDNLAEKVQWVQMISKCKCTFIMLSWQLICLFRSQSMSPVNILIMPCLLHVHFQIGLCYEILFVNNLSSLTRPKPGENSKICEVFKTVNRNKLHVR